MGAGNTELRRAPIIDFRPDDDGVFLVLGHGGEPEAEFAGEKGARNFDETEVGDVMDDCGAVGVEEHDLHFGLNSWRVGVQHSRIIERGAW